MPQIKIWYVRFFHHSLQSVWFWRDSVHDTIAVKATLKYIFSKTPLFYNSSTHTKLIANLFPKMYPIFEISSTPFPKIPLFLHIANKKRSRTCLEKHPNFREILHDHAYTTLKLSDDTGVETQLQGWPWGKWEEKINK